MKFFDDKPRISPGLMKKFHHRIRVIARVNGLLCTRLLDSGQLASLAGVSRRTAQRWIAAGRLPGAVQELIEHKLMGRLPDTARQLIDQAVYTRQEVAALRRRVRELEAALRVQQRAVDHWRGRAGQASAANDAD